MRRAALAPAFVATVSAVAACARSGGPEPESHPILANPPATAIAADPPDAEITPEPTSETPPGRDAGGAPDPDPNPDAPLRVVDFPSTLNPRDGNGRMIKRMWQGDQCYVELPFPPLRPGEQRRPGAAPPAQTIACPASMLTATFEQCRGGTVRGKNDGSACICFVTGNPPPPVRRVPCPDEK